jgi:predicted metal-binding membrane protein
MPQSVYPAIGIGFIAMIYQCSPLKQYSLNKGHDHRSLPAFGWPAFRAVTAFGLHHGIWCVGAGWALMLWPMLLPDWHNVAMIIVTFMMISEHMEHPQPVKWGLKPRLILLHYIVAEVSLGWWRGWKFMKTKIGQQRVQVDNYRVETRVHS